MDAAQHFDIHADIDILKLRVDEGIDAHTAHAWLETTRRRGFALADIQTRLHIIDGAHLRRL